MMYRTGDGVKSNQKKAAALFLRACDKDIGRACLSLGEHYFIAWGVPKDVTTGRHFLQKACALNDTLACNALYGAEPAGGGNVKATTRAWKQMIAAPSVQTLLNVPTNDELIQRLTRFRDAYASIDCRGADPELCEYVEAWKTVAARMIDVCERDERSKRTASNIETLGGMLGALFEKSKSGERHEDTLDRGMEKGSRKGKMIAEIMGLTGDKRAETMPTRSAVRRGNLPTTRMLWL